MQIASVDDLFQAELQKLHSIEVQLIEALPELVKNAESEELKKALSDHLRETKNQAKRLEEVGSEIDLTFDDKQDMGIKGILEEGKIALSEVKNSELKDTVIISGSEKVEHYEMAAYDSAMTLAEKMGMDEVAHTLQQTYNEEEKSAQLLKEMAQSEMGKFVGQVKAHTVL